MFIHYEENGIKLSNILKI